jgi:hypothetical protein
MSEPFESPTMSAPIKIIGQAATRAAPTRMVISRLRTTMEIDLTDTVPLILETSWWAESVLCPYQ